MKHIVKTFVGTCCLLPLLASSAPIADWNDENEKLLAACTKDCTFQKVSRDNYACLLDSMEDMILDPPEPATQPGVIISWPPNPLVVPYVDVGTLAFTMEPFVGTFSINVTYSEPSQTLKGVFTDKPAEIPYALIWGYVQMELDECRKVQ